MAVKEKMESLEINLIKNFPSRFKEISFKLYAKSNASELSRTLYDFK